MSTAAALAEQEAKSEFPDGGDGFLDAFGSFLMTNILSRAMTAATNIEEMFFPEAPEVACRGALTSDTVKRLWERYGKMATEESPLSREADDVDVAAFAVRLMAGAVGELPAGPQRRMRRMLSELADEDAISESVERMAKDVQAYVPGYRLKQRVQVDRIEPGNPSRIPGVGARLHGLKTSIFLEIEGAAHYLPAYAGNLDIMTSAALRTAESMAERMLAPASV